MKPHHLAHKADVPCWRCGHEWLRPVIDLSNPNADELPVYDVCARCKAKPNEFAAARATSPETE